MISKVFQGKAHLPTSDTHCGEGYDGPDHPKCGKADVVERHALSLARGRVSLAITQAGKDHERNQNSLFFALLGSASYADPVANLTAAVQASFDRMPTVQRVNVIEGRCGADDHVNEAVVYCTSQNRVFLARAAADRPEAAYLVAHVMGHAAQVRHGVADVALATIRANRDQESVLRADVTRQVECLAGFFYVRAGLPKAALTDWFSEEPFTGAHWGRDPLHIGPQVSIGLAERAAWFARGQSGNLAQCATASFNADLLLDALKG